MTDDPIKAALRSVTLGRWLFARKRAVSGAWEIKGVTRRLAIIRGNYGYARALFLILGPWVLVVGRVSSAAQESGR